MIHAFWVHDFLYKRDAIPGHVNEFDVTPTELGTYHGVCSEFCGTAPRVHDVHGAGGAAGASSRLALGAAAIGRPGMSVTDERAHRRSARR